MTSISTAKTIVIRLTGDSGDGMQLIGEELTITAAQSGKDVRTKPDFPAEIRAPSGSLAGVSGFQLAMSEKAIFTAGEELDVLVALNPAALKHSLQFLKPGGLLIINEDSFQEQDWKKAGASPDLLNLYSSQYQVISIPLISQTLQAIESIEIPRTQAKKTKNYYILGLVLWLFDLPLEHCRAFIRHKFQANPSTAMANETTLEAGYHYAMNLELNRQDFVIGSLTREAGEYRQVTGVEAVGLALAALAVGCQTKLFVAGYPITPASAILQEAAKLSQYGVDMFQAEDEIAALCSCLGASFGGCLALSATSGPGFDLKCEALGLAIATELPLVLIDVQRAGPSTGLPTKTGQSDLNQALYGRHGEAPLPVIAASSPADCFYTVIEAFRIAINYMTPVIVLMDSHLANAAEPWKIPSFESIAFPKVTHNQFPKPYQRNELLARSWNIPGSEGFIHQIGGLEKQGETGRISYDADNHQKMTDIRKQKIMNIADAESDYSFLFEEDPTAETLIIGWGSTLGSLQAAINNCKAQGLAISLLHLRHLNPMPHQLETIMRRYRKVLVAELNTGHLCQLIRGQYLIDARSIQLCNGQTFSLDFLVAAIQKEIHHDKACIHA